MSSDNQVGFVNHLELHGTAQNCSWRLNFLNVLGGLGIEADENHSLYKTVPNSSKTIPFSNIVLPREKSFQDLSICMKMYLDKGVQQPMHIGISLPYNLVCNLCHYTFMNTTVQCGFL